MHEPLLARAAVPDPVFVLGMRLKTYSIGHELLLSREWNVDGLNDFEALSNAVLICCHSWDENLHLPFDPLLKLKLWLWARRVRKMDLEQELLAFHIYRSDGSLEFPLSEIAQTNKPTPRASGGPYLLRIQQFLMTHLRLSESAAWDYPLGLASMRWCCHWEQEGGLNIYNAHDAEFDDYIQEQEAKGAAQCPA